MKTITIEKTGGLIFTLTHTNGSAFDVTVNKGEFWMYGDIEYDEQDYLVKNNKVWGSYDSEKNAFKFGGGYYYNLEGKKIDGLSVTEDVKSFLLKCEQEARTKWETGQKDREVNRIPGYPNYSEIVTYNIGCDTGLIYSKENREAIKLALENGAVVVPLLRGERDETNKYPGHMDTDIPASFAKLENGTWKADGYKYVYEERYAISRDDYNKAYAIVDALLKNKQDKKQRPFIEARETGKPVLISKICLPEEETPLAKDGEGDVVDVLTYAMPDGSTKTEYVHNY